MERHIFGLGPGTTAGRKSIPFKATRGLALSARR
jgi:hypothetical protein